MDTGHNLRDKISMVRNSEKINLPILQNWDCHVCGTCCKEYLVRLSEDEVAKIKSQNWDVNEDLGGYQPFRKTGLFKNKINLNHRPDGSCVFLGENNLCKIHGKFGLDAKPLPCQVFPYVLIPTGNEWSVGVRYACPSAAKNLGTSVLKQRDSIEEFKDKLIEREKFTITLAENKVKPMLSSTQDTSWEIIFAIRNKLTEMLKNGKQDIGHSLRCCIALSNELKSTNLSKLGIDQVKEFLDIFGKVTISDVPVDAFAVPSPNWVGRILFRQITALFTRKDHGPNRGIANKGRIALLKAAIQFARGTGTVPKLNVWVSDTTFENIESRRCELDEESNELLKRYYLIKIESLQFFGASNFGIPFWEGLNILLLTYPIIVWTSLAQSSQDPMVDKIQRAISLVDDHFGFNKILGGLRQRYGFNLLAQRKETEKLVAWYSRQSI